MQCKQLHSMYSVRVHCTSYYRRRLFLAAVQGSAGPRLWFLISENNCFLLHWHAAQCHVPLTLYPKGSNVNAGGRACVAQALCLLLIQDTLLCLHFLPGCVKPPCLLGVARLSLLTQIVPVHRWQNADCVGEHTMISARHRLCFQFDGNDYSEVLQPFRRQFEVLLLKACSKHPLSSRYMMDSFS